MWDPAGSQTLYNGKQNLPWVSGTFDTFSQNAAKYDVVNGENNLQFSFDSDSHELRWIQVFNAKDEIEAILQVEKGLQEMDFKEADYKIKQCEAQVFLKE